MDGELDAKLDIGGLLDMAGPWVGAIGGTGQGEPLRWPPQGGTLSVLSRLQLL